MERNHSYTETHIEVVCVDFYESKSMTFEQKATGDSSACIVVNCIATPTFACYLLM